MGNPTKLIFTEQERIALFSMAKYWDEVAKREVKADIMRHESQQLVDMFGEKIVWAVYEQIKRERAFLQQQEKEKV